MTFHQNDISNKEMVERLIRNIEHVEANMTSYPLFYENVKKIVEHYIGRDI